MSHKYDFETVWFVWEIVFGLVWGRQIDMQLPPADIVEGGGWWKKEEQNRTEAKRRIFTQLESGVEVGIDSRQCQRPSRRLLPDYFYIFATKTIF